VGKAPPCQGCSVVRLLDAAVEGARSLMTVMRAAVAAEVIRGGLLDEEGDELCHWPIVAEMLQRVGRVGNCWAVAIGLDGVKGAMLGTN
jgi:hypothetical protein